MTEYNYAAWLGPSLRRTYEPSMTMPSNWALIMQISSPDDVPASKANDCDTTNAPQSAPSNRGDKKP